MKTTMFRALTTFVCFAFVANFQAVAQTAASQGTVAPAAGQPATAATRSNSGYGTAQPAGAAAPQATYNQAPPNQASLNQTTADQTTADQTIDDSAMLDNGLWTDANVGEGCAICGTCNNAPPDWYTLQGVRIFSRGGNKKMGLSYQAPSTGTYGLTSANGGTTYTIKNNEALSFTIYSQGATGLTSINSSGNITGPSKVVDLRQLDLGVSSSYDATIGHYFCRDKYNNDHFVEFTFWGFSSWGKGKEVNGYLVPIYDETTTYDAAQAGLIFATQEIPTETGRYQGSLRTAFPMAGTLELADATDAQKTLSLAFNYGTNESFYFRSAMNNFEINGRINPCGQPDRLVMEPDGRWRRECQPGTYMSYLYGLRFMQLDETFTFHSNGTGPYNNDYTAATEDAVGDYGVVTHNSLLGLQIGAEMMFRKCRWAWGFTAKVGPYLNFADQESTINASVVDGQHDSYYRRLSAAKCQTALIAETGLQATYKFRPNLMGRAAYDFMWISGVAIAPEQLQFNAAPINRIGAGGVIYAQSVTLSLEWLW